MEIGFFRNQGNGAFTISTRTRTLNSRLAAVLLLTAGLNLSGCKEDCSAAAKLGDFEFSQGNFVNAVRQYEKALKADANCGIVGQKLADAKRRIAENQ
ncbi:MAG: hypothetical protein ABIW76_02365 [Fibrobacteria bacterium]